MNKQGYVYITTNPHHNVLYTGVTSDLKIRIWQHVNKVDPKSFTAKYNYIKLVWYDTYPNISDAIELEKQIKAGSRAAKEKLINAVNPVWSDLWEVVGQW